MRKIRCEVTWKLRNVASRVTEALRFSGPNNAALTEPDDLDVEEIKYVYTVRPRKDHAASI
jgi:hypothetical protein